MRTSEAIRRAVEFIEYADHYTEADVEALVRVCVAMHKRGDL